MIERNSNRDILTIKILSILILISLLILIIIICIILNILTSNTIKDPKINIYNISHIGISTAILNGAILTDDKYKIQYQFEFGINGTHYNNITHISIMDNESNNVSQFVSGLIPNTYYEYRLIVIYTKNFWSDSKYYYSSIKNYFKSCNIPLFKFVDIININTSINNYTVLCTGNLYNPCSQNLYYSGQVRALGSPNYVTFSKYKILPSQSWENISIYINGLSQGYSYFFRFIAFEENYDKIYYDTTHHFYT